MTKKNFLIKKILFLIALSLWAKMVWADTVDDYIVNEMKKQHIPGLSLAIVHGGKIIKEKG